MGAATTLLMIAKGLPLAYNKDMQETQEPVFAAADAILGCLEIAAGFARAMDFDFERMQAATSKGFMNAMAAATYLVRKGVPFRRAHEQIGQAVQYCLEKGCELEGLSLAELRRFSPDFADDVYASLTLAAVLGCHDVPGGTAPEQVQKAVTTMRKKIGNPREKAHARS
jgi:argininosuccinate lyase